MTKEEAMKLALEALELSNANHWWGSSSVEKAITALRRALANEALGKMAENAKELGLDYEPAQRTWVGLTNDEVNNLAAGCHLGNSVQDAIYKAVAKLKEKNNG